MTLWGSIRPWLACGTEPLAGARLEITVETRCKARDR